MFATIRSLIPEPRQAEQPRHYVGRHRTPETIIARATVAVLGGTTYSAPDPEAPPGVEPPAAELPEAEVPAAG